MTLLPKTCFFTGHRFIGAEDKGLITSWLREELLTAINGGYTHFITGGAVGFDMIAAEQILKMREEYGTVRLILYLPCADHCKGWHEYEIGRFNSIMEQADEVYYVSKEAYKEGCMKRRNRAMVEASDMCIAYLKKMSSGTAQTVKMACEKGIRIVNIAEKLFFEDVFRITGDNDKKR